MKPAVFFSALAMLGCTRTEHHVTMKGMGFDPPTLTVKSGDVIVWTNTDIVPHTVTAANRFDSGAIEPGKTYQITLAKPGTVAVQCMLHPTMRQQIVVSQ